jgi:hypothetical protein
MLRFTQQHFSDEYDRDDSAAEVVDVFLKVVNELVNEEVSREAATPLIHAGGTGTGGGIRRF